MRPGAVALAALLLACAPVRAAAPVADGAAAMLAVPPPRRPNAEMAADILDLAFETEGGRDVSRLLRFEGPIRVRLAGEVPATLEADLDGLLGRLREEAGLDVRRGGGAAEVVIRAVSGAAITRAVPGAACFVVPGHAAGDGRASALVVVPSDAAPQEARDCLHEELAQAIGPPGDLWRLPDSVFNDDDVHGALTGFDMLALRALHDGALTSGMTRDEVAARLPAVLARLNPAGERPAGPLPAEAPPGWAEAVRTAMAPGALPERLRAAEAAVALARGLGGPREGASLYALGRLRAGTDPEGALVALQAARAALSGPDTALHAAQVDAQLAALALAQGDGAAVLALTAGAKPVAEEHGDAGLLGTLLLLRAEATDGREAPALRLDGLGWARYGFGGAGAAARLAEVRALGPVAGGPRA